LRQDDPIACEGEDGGYKPPGSEGEGGEGEDGWELRRLPPPCGPRWETRDKLGTCFTPGNTPGFAQ
jgi:hypothetical protein